MGSSNIASGDASMGCAYGTFVPTPDYRAIQQHCQQHRDKWKSIPGLVVEASGVPVECSGGFQIVDYSPELGSEAIQLHLLGITAPKYSELFPDDQKRRQ